MRGLLVTQKKEIIGVLTFHHISNFGAFLYTHQLVQSLIEAFPEYDIKVIDFKSFSLSFTELVKLFKPTRQSPFFYFRRYLQFNKSRKARFPILKTPILWKTKQWETFIKKENITAMIVGMDVWNLSNHYYLPKFPNPYWLPFESLKIKIAYGVSGFRSFKIDKIKYQNKIEQLTNSFDFIGVRDKNTQLSIPLQRNKEVYNTPDPTFLFPIQTETKIALDIYELLSNKKLIGVMLHQQNTLSKSIYDFYHDKNTKLVGMSLYHKHVDINLGDKLSPFEWAEMFKYFDFTITSLFHGTIFSILNKIPFIAIEPFPIESKLNSKIFDLLKNIGVEDLYFNPYENNISISQIENKRIELKQNWEAYYLPKINRYIDLQIETHKQHFSKIQEIIRKNI